MNDLDATIAAAGSKVTMAGSGTAIGSWFLSSEFGVLSGVFIGLAGLAVNAYFKYRQDARLRREHEARMRGDLV
ncbi:holin [Achromobacter xylosoxidans]|uniref:holin n=1 Tax=Alcaligenes xylosoxydans xylosoxydans TaxID=85698 RepID=UPI0006C4442D|nr:holin [Achromobacter xylosoxidans]CUI55196.1 Uncharacterised protein [Achromobacter xylosoxidans]